MSHRIRLILLAVAACLSLPAAAGTLSQSYLLVNYSRASVDYTATDPSLEGDKAGFALRSAFGQDGFIFAEYRNLDTEAVPPRNAGDPAQLSYRAQLKEKTVGIGQYWRLGAQGEIFAKLGYTRGNYDWGGSYADYVDPAGGSASIATSGSLCSSAAVGSAYLPDFCGSDSNDAYMLGLGMRFQFGNWLEINAEASRYRSDLYKALRAQGIAVDSTVKKVGLDFLLGDASAIGLHYTDQGALSVATLALRLRF